MLYIVISSCHLIKPKSLKNLVDRKRFKFSDYPGLNHTVKHPVYMCFRNTICVQPFRSRPNPCSSKCARV